MKKEGNMEQTKRFYTGRLSARDSTSLCGVFSQNLNSDYTKACFVKSLVAGSDLAVSSAVGFTADDNTHLLK